MKTFFVGLILCFSVFSLSGMKEFISESSEKGSNIIQEVASKSAKTAKDFIKEIKDRIPDYDLDGSGEESPIEKKKRDALFAENIRVLEKAIAEVNEQIAKNEKEKTDTVLDDNDRKFNKNILLKLKDMMVLQEKTE